MNHGAAPAPLLGALVSQLCACAPVPRKPDLMLEREELVVEYLDGKNAHRQALADACGIAPRTIDNITSRLIKAGLIVSWKTANGRAQKLWYGLTPAGVKRARALKEMACQ